MNESVFRLDIRSFQMTKTLLYVLLLSVFLLLCFPLLVFPGITLLLPAYLLTALYSAGPVACLICTALCVVFLWGVSGPLGALCLALAVLPALIAGAFCLQKGKSFAFSLAAGFLALFAGGLCAVAAALLLCGGALDVMLTRRLEAFLVQSKYGDLFLLYGYLSGLLPLSRDVAVPALVVPSGFSGAVSLMGQHIVLNPQARQQLLLALLNRFDRAFLCGVPVQLLSGSLLGAALLQWFPRRSIRRRGFSVPLPDLRRWYVPTGYGRLLLIPLLGSWLWMLGALSALSELTLLYTSGAYIAFSVFSGAVHTVFALQGLALADELLYHGGTTRRVRTATMIAGYLLFGKLAAILGLADQYFDFRQLRTSSEDDNDHKQEDDF